MCGALGATNRVTVCVTVLGRVFASFAIPLGVFSDFSPVISRDLTLKRRGR
jgi:hypothetical protein